MTLATRCPACGTVFRVVQDQLRVSDGWVRCGRCSEAFNALEAMVEWPAARTTPPAPATAVEPASATAEALATTAAETAPAAVVEPGASFTPAGATGPAQAPQAVAEAPIEREREPSHAPASTPDADVDRRAAEPAAAAEPTRIELPPGLEVVATDGALSPELALTAAESPVADDRVEPELGFVSAPTPSPSPAPPAAEATSAMAEQPASTTPSTAPADEPEHAPQPAPSFMLQAERAERWRRPGVRLALGLASLVALLGLAAQVTYTFRDRIAAGSPAVRPLLQQACAAIGCRVGEYRQIDALSVESSGLTRVEGAPVYRLAVTLRNRAAVEVAAPALDLALTDVQGRPIARRVLQMSDLNLPLRSLKPGSELPIQVPLGIGGQVSGYAVEIFYP